MKLILSLFALSSCLLAQPDLQERTFFFTCSNPAPILERAGNVMNSILNTPVSISAERGSATVRANAEIMKAAEWMFQELNGSCGGLSPAFTTTRDFNIDIPVDTRRDERMIRAFYPTKVPAGTAYQEVMNLVRTVTDLQRMDTLPGKVIFMRGSARQLDFAQWALKEVEQSAPSGGAAPRFGVTRYEDEYYSRYPKPGHTSDQLVRAAHLPEDEPQMGLQETINMVRTVSDIQRMFQYFPSRVIMARSEPGQDALFAWLIEQLYKPAPREPLQLSETFAYEDPAAKAEMARVALIPGATNEQLLAAMNEIRRAANLQRIFPNTSHRAIAFRGTATQIEQASQILQDRFAPRKP